MTQEQGSSQDTTNPSSADASAPEPETEDAVLVGMSGVDDETAELLRTLGLPEVHRQEPSNVPLAGVLKRTRKVRQESSASPSVDDTLEPVEEIEESIVSGVSETRDVIAYEPIKVDALFGEGHQAPAITDDEPTLDAPAVPLGVIPSEEATEPGAEEVEERTIDQSREEVEFIPEEAAEVLEELISSDEIGLDAQAVPMGRMPTGAIRPPKPPPQLPRRVKEGEVVLTQDEYNELTTTKHDSIDDLDCALFKDNNWYKEVFTEDYFRTLPKNFHKQTIREVEFIIQRLGAEPGARILDLCCGFGRHTMEFAKRGFNMVGLDLAMPLLQKGLNEAQRRNLSIKFVHGDMRELNFDKVFDGIFNVQTSFGYFNDLTNYRVLQRIFRALKPGGRFLVETINRDFVVDDLPMRIWWEGTECLILEEVDYDFMLSTLQIKRSFVFEDSNRDPWEQHINIRLYTPAELSSLMRRAGFEVLELNGDYAIPGAFFGAASRRSILIAERPVDE